MIGPVRLKELPPRELERLMGRNKVNLETVRDRVMEILRDVRLRGDQALIEYTERFDGVKLGRGSLRVEKEEFEQALGGLPKSLLKALKAAYRSIRLAHERQLPKKRVLVKRPGQMVAQIFVPLDSVGLYVPGGRAAYPSTALMLAVPAKVAGVQRIAVCTPPSKDGIVNPAVLAALRIAGVREVYRVGGVQAIAALAYGTETIPKVSKIVGPGNIYVTAAKMLVYGEVGVEFPAGPTELIVFAGENADPEFVAADILSQAEHDPQAVPILLTTSMRLGEAVLRRLERAEGAVKEALENWGAILLVDSLEEAADFINRFAPEHLALHMAKPWKLVSKLRNVGAVSLGEYTPVPVLDYAMGPSHVLPTSGAARYASGVSVFDFVRFFTVQRLTRRGLKRLRRVVEILAEAEGLKLHGEAVRVRFRRRREK